MNAVTQRIVVAVFAIPVILLLAYVGGYAWMGFCVVVYVLSAIELRRMAAAKGADVNLMLALVAGIALLAVFMNERIRNDLVAAFGGIPFPVEWQVLTWITILYALAVPLWELFYGKGSALANIGASFVIFLYLGLFLGATLGIREIFSIGEFPIARIFGTAAPDAQQLGMLDHWGGMTMITILATIWICDTAAYSGGMALGKHKLFPRVSPNKTWEGAIFGFAGSVGAFYLGKVLFLEYLTVEHALICGAIIGLFGQIGDLIESLLKRDAAVKDSSSILPGHGGFFDRFDSLIFVSPILFLYFDFIVFG